MCVCVCVMCVCDVKRKGVTRAASSSINMRYVGSSLVDGCEVFLDAFFFASSLAFVTSGGSSSIRFVLLFRYSAMMRAVNVPFSTSPSGQVNRYILALVVGVVVDVSSLLCGNPAFPMLFVFAVRRIRLFVCLCDCFFFLFCDPKKSRVDRGTSKEKK